MTQKNKAIVFAVSSLIVFLAALSFILFFVFRNPELTEDGLKKDDLEDLVKEDNLTLEEQARKVALELKETEKFESEQDFKDYLNEVSLSVASSGFGYRSRGFAPEVMEEDMAVMESEALNQEMKAGVGMDRSEGALPSRISKTNVQVENIDEPDVVKTDGKNIFYSGNLLLGSRITIENSSEEIEIIDPIDEPGQVIQEAPQRRIAPDSRNDLLQMTLNLKAFPPEELAILSKIDKSGDMLIYEDRLVIFSETDNKIYGIKLGTKETSSTLSTQAAADNLNLAWEIEIKEESSIVTSRLKGDQIYLITRTNLNYNAPCPIRPLSLNGQIIELPCREIYHPRHPLETDITYEVLKIDIKSGEVLDKAAFTGSNFDSVVYMSADNLYLTYNYPGDLALITIRFINANQDLFNEDLILKLNRILSYDLSMSSKLNEVEILLENYTNSLALEERKRVENEMQNRMKDYLQSKKRDFEKTAVIKIGVDDLKIEATGVIPGRLLNQFSLDEFEGNLRTAVTVGSGPFGSFNTNGNENDLYILDENLKSIGEVQGMGLDEKIYSARFIGNKGYLVTFRQIDPFYVLDLSNPKNPEIKGELKIPGFSSYLHPISNDLILGIGEEDRKVKISLFDVSDPSSPIEKSKYNLDEYDSEILRNHHAFLLDQKHQLFFIPGSQDGYIFSYKDEELALKKVVTRGNENSSYRYYNQGMRAIYLEDYLYIFTLDGVTVIDEESFEEVKRFGF
jgi:uncharacterized secreted protein with C-terminal beta-propeller domain